MSTKDNNLLWEEIFNNTSQFWDNRNSKTRASLWIHGFQNPSWVTQKSSRFPLKGALNDRTSSEKNVESSDRMTYLGLIKLCGTKKNLRKGRKLHAEIIVKKLFPGDAHISTALLSMYAKCGAFEEAKEVFDQIQIRDVISWNALISGYAQNGLGDEVLKLFFQMGDYGIAPDGVTFVCVLKACGTMRNLKMGEEIHSSITKQGLVENDIVLGTALVDMYCKCGALEEAQQVFHKLPIRNIVSWNALITGYTHYGMYDEALNSFYRMQDEGISPDVVTFVCILKGCSYTKSLEMGEEIHLEVNQQGLLAKNLILGTALVDMYAKCGRLQKAQEVFDKLARRDVVLWSALIGGYTEHGLASEALILFRKMRDEGIAPDAVTFVCVLKACASIRSLEMGEDIYAEVCKNGLLEKDIVLGNSLVDMYSKCGLLGKAQEVFDKLKVRNVISWNALISGYTQHGLNDEALSCFRQMRDEGISPNVVTFTCILKVCSAIRSLDIGQMIHEEVRKQMLLENDIMVGVALVDMYAKCGELEKAKNVFDAIPLRDVVIWDALIGGYAQQGLVDEALYCLKKMRDEGFTPDVITFNSALKACGTTGFLNIGEEINDQIRRLGLLGKDSVLGKTLVGMYAKCGELGKAHEAFNELQVQDVVSWSSLMACYAQLGQAKRVLILFNGMISEGIVPDPVSFLVLLTTCSHAGIVEEGEKVFDDMDGIHNLVPTLEHYACMVDMFTRAGQFSKALAMLEKVPSSDHLPLLLAFLGACHKGVNAELGRWAFERSLLLDGKCRAAYICMGNIYAISGMYAYASM